MSVYEGKAATVLAPQYYSRAAIFSKRNPNTLNDLTMFQLLVVLSWTTSAKFIPCTVSAASMRA